MTDLDIQIQELMSCRLGRLPAGGIDPTQAARAFERLERALGRLESVERRLDRVAVDAERRGAAESPAARGDFGPRCRRCRATGVLRRVRATGSTRIACPQCDGEATGHVR